MGLDLRAVAVGPLNAFSNLSLTQISAFEKSINLLWLIKVIWKSNGFKLVKNSCEKK